MTEVAPGVHRLGHELVNFYLVEDGDKLTLIDAGAPKHWEQVPALISSLGRSLSDLEAVVLTHAHPDHIGAAEQARTDAGARVLVHSADERMATEGDMGKRESSFLPYLRHPAAWKLVWVLSRAGATGIRKVSEVETFEDGAELDVPGRPRVVHVPGHSQGSVLLVLPDRGVVFGGDVINTYNPVLGRDGPQLAVRAFCWNTEQAMASLDRLAAVEAETLLVGHGDPWTKGPAEAARIAREVGPT